jgi:hypothetical protein
MCAFNRVSVENPAHLDCAEFAVRACPFLSNPNARRNTAAALGDGKDVPGIMLQHNPGVNLLWTTKTFRPIRDPNGVLFSLGEPTSVSWWHRGRKATRAEIDAAIAIGLPKVREVAESEGPEAVAEFEQSVKRAQYLFPAE